MIKVYGQLKPFITGGWCITQLVNSYAFYAQTI